MTSKDRHLVQLAYFKGGLRMLSCVIKFATGTASTLRKGRSKIVKQMEENK